MKTRIVLCRVPVLLLAIWITKPLAAQLTAEINGTVKDASGAIVPNAKITLTNADTGVRRERVSNSEGYYAFPILQPATYKVTAETPGFKPVRYENVKLDVAQTIKIDFKLDIGDSSQTVEVRDTAELLDSGVSAIGQVVGEKSVANLPTNGRNSYSFITLVPGVRAPAGFQAAQITNVSSAFVSINGARPNQSAFYLDGGNNSQSNFNGPTYTPSLDVVQEFKVQTNNFSAEYTNTAGGVVNLITRSGTNAFHGTLYEFLRNDKFDANGFFLNRAGISKAEYRFNQFGGTTGGPVIKNRTFFFFGYEGFRLVQGVTLTNTLPTAEQRAGDFSQTRTAAGQLITIYDPLSTRSDPANPGRYLRTPFTGNKIPAGRFDPVAANLLKFIPLPNSTGAPVTGSNNFVSNASAPTNKDDLSAADGPSHQRQVDRLRTALLRPYAAEHARRIRGRRSGRAADRHYGFHALRRGAQRHVHLRTQSADGGFLGLQSLGATPHRHGRRLRSDDARLAVDDRRTQRGALFSHDHDHGDAGHSQRRKRIRGRYSCRWRHPTRDQRLRQI